MNSSGQATKPILVVDDERPARRILRRVLEGHGYDCVEADGFDAALQMLADGNVSLVLTDLDMPGRSGLELLAHIRDAWSDVPTVIITGRGSADLGEQSVRSGAYGYLSKPVREDDVLTAVINARSRRSIEDGHLSQERELKSTVALRTEALWTTNIRLAKSEEEVRTSREETIHRLAIAAELRDDETARHVERMSRYAGLLATNVLRDSDPVDSIRLASVLHDVGKIGIPDQILRKPGKLTADEYETMKTHAELGARILSGSNSPLLDFAATIAHTHHERVDGSGYPRGLRGDEIPLEGRIAAIADVFDALTTARVYRKEFELVTAVEMLKEGRGSQFDPDLLDLFLDLLPELLEIKDSYQ